MPTDLVNAHAISARVISTVADAGDQFVPIEFARDLQRQIKTLQEELQLAVDCTTNDYHWDGHAARVAAVHGILVTDPNPVPEGYRPGASFDMRRARGGRE